jgi:WhiB family redox-sensing transcriptional regulator
MMAIGINDQNWRDFAFCRDHPDPDDFHPVSPAREPEAAEFCVGCPALEFCLGFALEHRITDGIWGGTTASERRALLRKRSRASAPMKAPAHVAA